MSDKNNGILESIFEECRKVTADVDEVNELAAEAQAKADSHLDEYAAAVDALRSGGAKHLLEIVDDLEKAVNIK